MYVQVGKQPILLDKTLVTKVAHIPFRSKNSMWLSTPPVKYNMGVIRQYYGDRQGELRRGGRLVAR